MAELELWGALDVAEELEVHLTTVRRWIREGRILPPPAARTRAGVQFWTSDQMKEAVRNYHNRPTIRGRRYGSRKNEGTQ